MGAAVRARRSIVGLSSCRRHSDHEGGRFNFVGLPAKVAGRSWGPLADHVGTRNSRTASRRRTSSRPGPSGTKAATWANEPCRPLCICLKSSAPSGPWLENLLPTLDWRSAVIEDRPIRNSGRVSWPGQRRLWLKFASGWKLRATPQRKADATFSVSVSVITGARRPRGCAGRLFCWRAARSTARFWR